VGKDAVDVLLRSALEDLELRTIPSSARTKACGQGKGELIAARAAYLDLDLVEALAAADRAREALRSAEAVLFACSELDSVELFMAQVHLDRQNEPGAREMMAGVLARGAVMAPDPAKYTPDFQALWEQLARGGVGTQGPPLDTKAMERLGASVGAEWIVLASLDGPDGAGERLTLAVVSSAERVDKSGVAQLVLGTTGGWGATVRKALAQFFPTRALQMRPERGIRETDEAMATAKKPIFRRWWFWTVVGVVVVGGAAAAIAAAVNEPSPTKVVIDLPTKETVNLNQ
jgi:hypothetical protein